MKDKREKKAKKATVENLTDDVTNEINEEVRHQRRERHGGLGAVLLITVGIILLLNNLEVLPWSIWENLWKFWPVLLILAGVDSIFGKSWIADIIVTLIGVTISWLIVANVLSLTVPEFNTWLTNNFPQSKIPAFQNYLRDKGVK